MILIKFANWMSKHYFKHSQLYKQTPDKREHVYKKQKHNTKKTLVWSSL